MQTEADTESAIGIIESGIKELSVWINFHKTVMFEIPQSTVINITRNILDRISSGLSTLDADEDCHDSSSNCCDDNKNPESHSPDRIPVMSAHDKICTSVVDVINSDNPKTLFTIDEIFSLVSKRWGKCPRKTVASAVQESEHFKRIKRGLYKFKCKDDKKSSITNRKLTKNTLAYKKPSPPIADENLSRRDKEQLDGELKVGIGKIVSILKKNARQDEMTLDQIVTLIQSEDPKIPRAQIVALIQFASRFTKLLLRIDRNKYKFLWMKKPETVKWLENIKSKKNPQKRS